MTEPTAASYLDQKISSSPLATFRILFGLLMAFSMVRFWYNGWIEKLYIDPSFHFKYFGFGWVSITDSFTYLLFFICFLSAIGVALGFKYRFSIVTFFLSFTYIELLDKTTYLNHYYFISVVSLIMIFLPMAASHSWDTKDRTSIYTVPRWCVDAFKLMLAVVYIYAGLAKLNHDWMMEAKPLSIWLSTKTNLPLVGSLMDDSWLHYFFSWAGAIYDLVIVFLLLYRPTRLLGFALVVAFHLMTGMLFPIGMFPYIMIASSLIFFDPSFHNRLLRPLRLHTSEGFDPHHTEVSPIKKYIVGALLITQIILPFRFLAYPGNLYWTEQGYRFSWRVMLMEKTGIATFKIMDSKTGKRFYVQNDDFLHPQQEKQMATQPDMILEYAHYLGNHFSSQGHQNVAVYVDSYASLNGRPSQQFIDPSVDLMQINEGFSHKEWILPLDE